MEIANAIKSVDFDTKFSFIVMIMIRHHSLLTLNIHPHDPDYTAGKSP